MKKCIDCEYFRDYSYYCKKLKDFLDTVKPNMDFFDATEEVSPQCPLKEEER